MRINNPACFGTITFDRPEEIERAAPDDPRRKITFTRQPGVWRPPPRIEPCLPDDFKVPLHCDRGSDGARRIIFACSAEELIDLAGLGGLAVIHDIKGFDRQRDYSYRLMQLIHQRVRGRANRGTRGMREHLTRQFAHSSDLVVRPGGRQAEDEGDVLPDDLGSPASRDARRWSRATLAREGDQAARAAGYARPSPEQVIRFGFLEAARRDPLEVSREQVEALVRLSLYDMGAGTERPSEREIAIVLERLLKAFKAHLDDDQTRFDSWFSGPGNTLIKQLAKQKKARGGALATAVVRGALLELGWRSYRYVGDCVHCLTRTIGNAMPEPLTEEERACFARMHERQACYGNLPLVLLAERIRFLQPAIEAIWAAADEPRHVQVLHRMLWQYADMVQKRRAADRLAKRDAVVRPNLSQQQTPPRREGAAAAPDEHGESARPFRRPREYPSETLEPRASIDPSSASFPITFKALGDHLRERLDIQCPQQHCIDWDYRIGDWRRGEQVNIEARCSCGAVVRTISLPEAEFIALREDFQYDKPPGTPPP